MNLTGRKMFHSFDDLGAPPVSGVITLMHRHPVPPGLPA